MKHSIHKRAKFGCLPGDVSKSRKIAMLEGESTSLGAKTYRKDLKKSKS